ncbi:unnamed protein product [Acanthoscelides obtectus]|uniref:DUF4371 domain-containing protein n=1 Tax=Acanthoscelides obtectus TaxID=200917 RepID=A0A9P0PYT1_ACAOB|nr:unnamed protein product [Acanthoscelides obtectus]CAK1638723.1 Protein ZBED8 [Acanthoscelides obtectus]
MKKVARIRKLFYAEGLQNSKAIWSHHKKLCIIKSSINTPSDNFRRNNFTFHKYTHCGADMAYVTSNQHSQELNFEQLHCNYQRELSNKRPTLDRMFASTSQRNDGLRSSYNISLLIAKSGKAHTIGEKLILSAVEEVLKTVLHKPASDIIKRIPLSNNTVERRIDEMSSDIESFLCNYLQTTHFSIQLDESTLPDNAALLLAYVRFIMNQEIYEELLFARTLITDTKGESIFHVLKDYFIEKAIPLSNIISVATDGAPAMTSCQEDDVSTYVEHLNALYSDFESRFEDILTMVIPPWIINPYGDIEEKNVIIQEELTELSTNEELKVQFKNGYQQFWLQNNIPLNTGFVQRRLGMESRVLLEQSSH